MRQAFLTKRDRKGVITMTNERRKMMEKKANKIRNNPNTKLFAENNNKNGFCIFLDVSGQRDCLVVHRQNHFLFSLLKDGISIGDLRRWSAKPYKFNAHRKTVKANIRAVNHLLKVTDEFILEELAYIPPKEDQMPEYGSCFNRQTKYRSFEEYELECC